MISCALALGAAFIEMFVAWIVISVDSASGFFKVKSIFFLTHVKVLRKVLGLLKNFIKMSLLLFSLLCLSLEV